MTEGTTRLLETPERQAPFNQNVYEQPGSLAQATNRLPPQVNQTSRSLETKDKSRQWVLISSLLVAALMLTTLLIVLWGRSSTTTTPVSPPAVTRPDLPPIQTAAAAAFTAAGRSTGEQNQSGIHLSGR